MNLMHLDGQAGECREAPNLGAIHERILFGDSAANEELAQVLLPWLRHELFKEFFHTDAHLISDAATEAVKMYLGHPASFDQRLGPRLDHFLLGVAHHKLDNIIRGDTRRRTMEGKAAAEPPYNLPETSAWAESGRIEAEKICEAVRQGLRDPADRELFTLWLGCERHTPVFALLMGITSLPSPDQSKLVQCKKDRFRKLLTRAAHKSKHHPGADTEEATG